MKKDKEPWQIAAARFCVNKSETGFTTEELGKYVRSIYKELSEAHLNQFFEEEIFLPTGRKFSRTHKAGYWIPPLELVSKITDYDELREARKNSKEAKRLAITAIIISILVGTIQLWWIQEVRIVNDILKTQEALKTNGS